MTRGFANCLNCDGAEQGMMNNQPMWICKKRGPFPAFMPVTLPAGHPANPNPVAIQVTQLVGAYCPVSANDWCKEHKFATKATELPQFKVENGT